MNNFDEERSRYFALKKEAGEKLKEVKAKYEAVKPNIVARQKAKLEKAKKKLTPQELEMLQWAQKTEKTVEKVEGVLSWISVVFGLLFAIGIPVLLLTTGAAQAIGGGLVTLVVIIGSGVGGCFGGGFLMTLILSLITGNLWKERKIKKIYKMAVIKTYLQECEDAVKEEKEYETKIKEFEQEYNEWANKIFDVDHREHQWKVMNKVGKVVEWFDDWMFTVKTSSNDTTYTIYDDGKKDLNLDERQGGYDTQHGWHDVYVDDMGHKYGTTDDGQTFFRKD